MNIKKVKISEIEVRDRLWEIDSNTVDSLKESIELIGLKTPPSVREIDGKYVLTTGNHRLNACIELGFDEIEVIVDNVDDNYAVLHEIDENLMRRAVHYAERAYQINVRKDIYNKLHGETLSTQASFNRYYKDVKAIVLDGRRTSRYDYTAFTESDLNYEYFKDRVDTNHMEDLFGTYTSSDGVEITKNLTDEDVRIANVIYSIMKSIDENIEYIPDFISDVASKLDIAEGTVKNDLLLGSRVNADDVSLLKNLSIDKGLATKIAKDTNKDNYMELLNDISQTLDDTKIVNKVMKNAIKTATKEVLDETGSKDSDAIFEKVKEEVMAFVSGENKSAQNQHSGVLDLSSVPNIDEKLSIVAQTFDISIESIKASLKKDTLTLKLKL